MTEIVPFLPHLNASLNALATVLLIAGLVLIKRGRELAHRRVMLSCFGVSVLFLVSYLIYHSNSLHTPFPEYPPMWAQYFYRIVLFSHIVLAAFVPFLALITLVLGLWDRRRTHRRLARWTFPIWLYVSVTGVVVYLMLYQLYPPKETQGTIKAVSKPAGESLRESRSLVFVVWEPSYVNRRFENRL